MTESARTPDELQEELGDARLLQAISADMIVQQDVEALYEQIMDVAMSLAKSQFASMQSFCETAEGGDLLLLAQRGFTPYAATFWKRVRADSSSTCAIAMRVRERVVATDVEQCDFLAGTDDLETYRQTGIKAVQTTPLLSRSGRLLGMMSTHWDRPHTPSERELRLLDILARQASVVIERKQADEQIRESEERFRALAGNMTELVAKRTAELEETHHKLRLVERMAALGTLAAGLGHDMSNLLVPMRVRLETIRAMDLPEEGGREVLGIQAGLNYLQKLASSLRLLASDPDMASHEHATELRSWWTETSTLLKSALPPGVTLKATLPNRESWAGISKAALMQVVFNLVQNSGQAMRGAAAGLVQVDVEAIGDSIVLTVTDDGPGMTDEVKARCVEPFYTTKPRDVSTGLGLALVYGLVQQAGGTVAFESAVGRGTAFTLRLPSRTAFPPRPQSERIEARSSSAR